MQSGETDSLRQTSSADINTHISDLEPQKSCMIILRVRPNIVLIHLGDSFKYYDYKPVHMRKKNMLHETSTITWTQYNRQSMVQLIPIYAVSTNKTHCFL